MEIETQVLYDGVIREIETGIRIRVKDDEVGYFVDILEREPSWKTTASALRTLADMLDPGKFDRDMAVVKAALGENA